MKLSDVKPKLDPAFYEILKEEKIDELRPCQSQAIESGLLDKKNLLICTPTASGKTLCAELAMINNLLTGRGREENNTRAVAGEKAIYLVPLKALAVEKFRDFKRKYEKLNLRLSLSIGDLDSQEPWLADSNLIICTVEKLDSLLRHRISWLSEVKTVIADEIHLLNDPGRGPTLEVILTLLKTLIAPQLIGLSATIGNPAELAEWLEAELVIDDWRPVKLRQGIHCREKTEFYER